MEALEMKMISTSAGSKEAERHPPEPPPGHIKADTQSVACFEVVATIKTCLANVTPMCLPCEMSPMADKMDASDKERYGTISTAGPLLRLALRQETHLLQPETLETALLNVQGPLQGRPWAHCQVHYCVALGIRDTANAILLTPAGIRSMVMFSGAASLSKILKHCQCLQPTQLKVLMYL